LLLQQALLARWSTTIGLTTKAPPPPRRSGPLLGLPLLQRTRTVCETAAENGSRGKNAEKKTTRSRRSGGKRDSVADEERLAAASQSSPRSTPEASLPPSFPRRAIAFFA